jgi:3-oxoadipate enol-lactonase
VLFHCAQRLPDGALAASISPEALRRRAMVRFVNNRVDGADFSGWAAAELARNDPAALLRAGNALANFDSRGLLATIDVPTAVVVTEKDRIVPPARQLAQANAIPAAEVFSAPGDHVMCVGDDTRFVPVLVAACRSVARRATEIGRTAPTT